MTRLQKLMAGLAVGGSLLIASGVALVYLPAGLIAGGVEAIVGAYVVAYLGRPK